VIIELRFAVLGAKKRNCKSAGVDECDHSDRGTGLELPCHTMHGPSDVILSIPRGDITAALVLPAADLSAQPASKDSAPVGGSSSRRMRRSQLLGRHTHEAAPGTSVHIWSRKGRWLARGRFDGRAFGETLGGDEAAAERRLHQVLVELENGTYQRPSDSRGRLIKTGAVPKFTLRGLCDSYLTETRSLRGKETAMDYRSRLAAVLEFAETQPARRRWPLAADIDRDFAVQLRQFLFARQVTGNGHPNTATRTTSPRQVYNVLDCLRTMLNWARRPEVHAVPSAFVNPLTKDIVGERQRRDPLAPTKLPLESRIELVQRMDDYQLMQVGLALVLPLRPDELTALLISDVDWHERFLSCGTRFAGRDYNKGRQSFRIPFPPELEPLLRRCAGGRLEGPLLRSRKLLIGSNKPKITLSSRDELARLLDQEVAAMPAGAVQSEQDAKSLFRRLLLRMGGTSPDALGKEFKKVLGNSGRSITIRDLRSSISTEMNQAGMSHLALRYVTGHTTGDIMNNYVAIDVQAEIAKYFRHVQQLLDAIAARASRLAISQMMQ
jgi:integrase